MRLRMRRAMCAVLVVGALGVLSPAAQAQDAGRLRILLTNDDGIDAAGLKAIKAALESAGHRVIVGAPAIEQSSSGTRVSTAPFKVEQRAADAWAVHGSPVDSVAMALQFMGSRPPDLVVSGINRGANLGPALSSGTVAAAAFAAARGLPAIAVSAGVPPEETKALLAYSQAAGLVVRMIASLCAPRCESTMASGVVVNVNYPAAEAKGLLVVPPAEQLSLYVKVGEDWQTSFQTNTTCQDSTVTDRAAFYCSYATVTVLTATRQLDAPEGRALAERLKALNLTATSRR